MAEQIRPLWGHPDCQQIATHLYFDKKIMDWASRCSKHVSDCSEQPDRYQYFGYGESGFTLIDPKGRRGEPLL